MVKNTDRTPAFTILALLAALLLAVAAGVLWWQWGGDEDKPALGAEAVGVAYTVVSNATLSMAGDSENRYERLESSLERLDALTASRDDLPGDPRAWTSVEENARAMLSAREDTEALRSASAAAAARIGDLLAASDALLEVSGATDVVQEFQRRAFNLKSALERLPDQLDASPGVGQIRDHLAYLSVVTDALAGADTELDVAALSARNREAVLAPLVAILTDVETAAETAITAATERGDLAPRLDALSAAAAGIQRAASGDPAESAGGLASDPLIPLLLVGGALLLLLILIWMHSRTAVFERASKEQAEQNERNQQAILRLLDELGSLADGDLTVEATVTEDITGAIADSINYAIEKLRELVATINETAIMVDSAAKQTESTAVHMARAADNQNREIRAATESIMSMAASIEEVSGNAERSSDVARHSVEVAHKGGEAVRRTIDGMNAIRETIQDTSKRIKRLGESSQEIGNIVELINDIAEQTNILALNASIQASMAGEAGRGFAVVADEVQRLAERSTNATKQIEVLVRTIQSDTNEAVVSMERSTTDVVGGALLAENAGAALDEIEQVSNQIASLVQNISGSAREQAGAAADVTRRTSKLKQISDQTGKATTATAAAISKLSVLASQLRQTVAGFTLPSSAFESSALSGKRTTTETGKETRDVATG
jgi:twitching motility protein PilJ